MKKHLSIILFLFLVSPIVWANDIYFSITQTNSVSEIQTGLQAAIDNATSSDKIIVTGSKTNADVTLTINIPTNKIVVWKAIYQASLSLNNNALIKFLGDGILEIEGGTLTTNGSNAILSDGANAVIKVNSGTISSTTGETIKTTGENAIVIVSAGTITATSENAILAKGINAKVYISGGIVSNAASTGSYPVIFMNTINNNGLNVIISGTGKVIATIDGSAISTFGSVEVKDNAYVYADMGNVIQTGKGAPTNTVTTISNASKIESTSNICPAIYTMGSVEVRDNAYISTSNVAAIYSASNNTTITISGTSKIESANSVSIETWGNVEVKDNAQVIAKKYPAAISVYFNDYYDGVVNVSGGLVFANTTNTSTVIGFANFVEPTNTGVILAWNNEAGTNYEIFSTDDILKLPESAIAYWDRKGSEQGISYTNGENVGFISLDVSVLSINESVLSNILIYPNPTTEELRIADGGLRIESVVFYDFFGKIQKIENRKIGNVIDISHLSAGVYFVKIRTETGEVVRKVVKE